MQHLQHLQTRSVDTDVELAKARLSSAVYAWAAQNRYGKPDGHGQRRDLDPHQAEVSRWTIKLAKATDDDFARRYLTEQAECAGQIYGPAQITTEECGRPSEAPPRDWEK